MEQNKGIEEFAKSYKDSPRCFDIRENSMPPVLNIIDGKNVEIW